MRKYKIQITPIKFDSLEELMETVYALDNIRLYQSNKPCIDPDNRDVLDGNNLGSGVQLGFEYDRTAKTVTINSNGGVCAVSLVQQGFLASEAVLDMSDQFDFLLSLKHKSYNQPDIQARIQVFENATLIKERSILLQDYKSKYF